MKWGAFMVKNQKRNAGFSLVELIIVVAIMAVLVGVIAPQWLKYVERSRRVTDVNNAKEIRDIYERIAAIDNLGTSSGRYRYTAGMMWDKNTRLPTTATSVMDAAFMEMGEIPVSATDQDYCWGVDYDAATGAITKIYLCPHSPSGAPDSSIQYELWPNPSNFLQNGLN